MLYREQDILMPAYRGGREFALRSPGLVLGIPMEDIDPNGRVIQPHHAFVAQGRNILSDSDMETNHLFYWLASVSGTATKETGTPHSGTRCLRIARSTNNNPAYYQNVLTTGRLFRAVGFFRSDGNAIPRILNNATVLATGTNSTEWQAFDTGNFIANSQAVVLQAMTSTGNQYCEFDDIQVFELNIPSSVKSFGTQLLADGDMDAADTSAWQPGNASNVITKETTNPYQGTRVLRTTRGGGVNNPFAKQENVLVIGKRYRATGKMRSDGNATPRIGDESVPTAFTGTTSTNWQNFEASFIAANVNFVTQAVTSTGSQYCEFDDIRVVEDLTIFPGNRIMDGDMAEVDTRWWNASANASVSKQSGVLRVQRVSGSNPYTYQNCLIVGKMYRVKGRCRSGGGTAQPNIYIAAAAGFTGTTSTNWQSFDFTGIASRVDFAMSALNSAGSEYTEFADVTVEEISPLTPAKVNANVIIDRAARQPELRKSARLPAQHIDIYSMTLSSTYPEQEGTIVWVGDMDTWLGASADVMVRLASDASSNYIVLSRSGGFGVPQGRYAGNNSQWVTIRPINLDIIMPHPVNVVAMAYSVSQNFVRLYINGKKVIEGSGLVAPLPGRHLDLGNCVIGANTTLNDASMTGDVEGVYLYNIPYGDEWQREFALRHGVPVV